MKLVLRLIVGVSLLVFGAGMVFVVAVWLKGYADVARVKAIFFPGER